MVDPGYPVCTYLYVCDEVSDYAAIMRTTRNAMQWIGNSGANLYNISYCHTLAPSLLSILSTFRLLPG